MENITEKISNRNRKELVGERIDVTEGALLEEAFFMDIEAPSDCKTYAVALHNDGEVKALFPIGYGTLMESEYGETPTFCEGDSNKISDFDDLVIFVRESPFDRFDEEDLECYEYDSPLMFAEKDATVAFWSFIDLYFFDSDGNLMLLMEQMD